MNKQEYDKLKKKFNDQEWRHNFKSGATNYCEQSEQKNLESCTPTYDILGVQQLQRDIRRAYRTALPRNMLATIFLTGRAFIGL